jgi:hypothetical protein
MSEYCPYNMGDRRNVVGIATWLVVWSSNPSEGENFRTLLDPPLCRISSGCVSPGIKRPGRGVDHPPPSSTEVNEIFTCTPPLGLRGFLHSDLYTYSVFRDELKFQRLVLEVVWSKIYQQIIHVHKCSSTVELSETWLDGAGCQCSERAAL